MDTTSATLLERLRQQGEEEAWSRLVELYTPMMYYWARRLGMSEGDAADLVQDVFAVLVQKLPEFVYEKKRSFRGWLRTIVVNKWRDLQRRRMTAPRRANSIVLDMLPSSDSAEAQWDAEYHKYLVGRALDLMRSDFQTNTWKACWELIASDKSAETVAVELGMSVDAVYAAKSRVLRRLRRELDGLLD